MKRLVYRNDDNSTEVLELDIFVELAEDAVLGKSILDVDDPAFVDFEINIMSACDIHDFELIDEYASNNPNSLSKYYVYEKTNEEGTKLKVLLKIRVSDHTIPDRKASGKLTTYTKRDQRYMNHEAKKLATEKYGQSRGYRARHLNIVFNDENFTSYEAALRAIEGSLDDFDPE